MGYTKYKICKTLEEFVSAIPRVSTCSVEIKAKQISRDPSDGSARYSISCEFNSREYDSEISITRFLVYDNVLIESTSELKEWKANKCREIYSRLKKIGIKSDIQSEEFLIINPSN